MGYVRASTIKVTWDDDSELNGLEIRTKRVSIDKYLEFEEYVDKVDEGDAEATKKMLALFAEVLVSWNLENQDDEEADPVPVPATLDGIYSQDLPFMMAICLRWTHAMAGITSDLGKDSTAGLRFPEGSIPMDVSPNALESLLTPS